MASPTMHQTLAAPALNENNTDAPTRRLFTVDEYHRMAEVGILGEDDPVELIEGEIIQMAPIGVRHAECVDQLAELFLEKLLKTVRIRTQNPLRIAGSELEPDVMILRRRPDSYRKAPPSPADVLLLIEVSESTLAFDRQQKLAIYAQAGIREYWIVNLIDNQIEIYTQPKGRSYEATQIAKSTDSITATQIPALTLTVEDILS